MAAAMTESILARPAHVPGPRECLDPATPIGGASLIAARLVAVFMIAGSSTGQSVLRWLT